MGKIDGAAGPIRGRILEAATRSVRRHGIRRTSIGEVARLAELSRGTVYLHFADKNALIEAVFEAQLRAFKDAGQAVVRRQKTLLKKVVELIVWSTMEMGSGLFLDLGETEPETFARLARDRAHLHEGLNFWPEHVRQAIASGELRSDIDVGQASDWITHIVISMVTFPPVSLDAGNRRELQSFLKDFLIRGLGRSPAAADERAA